MLQISKLATFPTKYPSGGEKQIIEILTGQQVPSGGIPADIGIVCVNPGTAVATKRGHHRRQAADAPHCHADRRSAVLQPQNVTACLRHTDHATC